MDATFLACPRGFVRPPRPPTRGRYTRLMDSVPVPVTGLQRLLITPDRASAGLSSHLFALGEILRGDKVSLIPVPLSINMLLSRSSWIAAFLVLNGLHARSASVQLGQTTVTGRNIPSLKQEFFGGTLIYSFCVVMPHEHASGIPYAEPPVGQLRLKPPVNKLSLTGSTFDASQYGLGCIQPAAVRTIAVLIISAATRVSF